MANIVLNMYILHTNMRNCLLLEKRERGQRAARDDAETIEYMPHVFLNNVYLFF